MLIRLSLEYCYLVFIAGVGILQAAAAWNDLKGLLFYRNKGCSYLFSALAVIPALIYFFTWNKGHATGIIEGSQQALLFTGSVFLAVFTTLLISSLINHNLRQPAIRKKGLEALREISFYSALKNGLKNAKNNRC
jgi:hypothetical protein